MSFRFHPEAYDEFLSAAFWYEDQEVGLGDDFIAGIDRAVASIVSDPLRFRVVEGPDRILRRKTVSILHFLSLRFIDRFGFDFYGLSSKSSSGNLENSAL